MRARLDLAIALADAREAPGVVGRRLAAQLGLPALRLYAFDVGPARPGWDGEVAAELVRLCQETSGEREVLSAACARLRDRLHAAAVGVVCADASRPAIVASNGGRIDPDATSRALSIAAPVQPRTIGDRVEAAAPITYGGDVLGSIVIRWAIGTPYDLSHAVPLMSLAAAAVAPVVAALRAHERRAETRSVVDGILGVSAATADLRRTIEQTADSPFPVLVEGESGSGKELVARALHALSRRRERTFSPLNCAAIPDDLVESELFGHARGAFTGAMGERVGVFEEAHGGTLFLDEVGELSLRAQAKLLRAIQEGEFRRVGENLPRRADVRVVSATNRDLAREVGTGRFRLDLAYRLDVVRIRVPPLRERPEDIPLLVDHYWRVAAARVGSRATLAPAAVATLAQYHWPGNVRELQNVLAALVVRSPRRGLILPTALSQSLPRVAEPEASRLEEARRVFDERFVRAALVKTGGHRGHAARSLGVSRQGLRKLMTRLGIE